MTDRGRELRRAARDVLRGAFGVDTERLRLVRDRWNAVFDVRARDRRRFLLRLHCPDYHALPAIASELAWLAALDETGLAVPRTSGGG